jgi:hypothetical protein
MKILQHFIFHDCIGLSLSVTSHMQIVRFCNDEHSDITCISRNFSTVNYLQSRIPHAKYIWEADVPLEIIRLNVSVLLSSLLFVYSAVDPSYQKIDWVPVGSSFIVFSSIRLLFYSLLRVNSNLVHFGNEPP